MKKTRKIKEKYSKENLEILVKESLTLSEVLKKLNIRCAGSNYRFVRNYISKYKLNIEHFESEKQRLKGLIKFNFENKKTLKEILTKNSSYCRTHLKQRLYDDGLKKRECEECGQGEVWRGKKISLILDHKNGVHNDNRIENLRILCPNCNATLDTHCGKNTSKKNKFKKAKVCLSKRKVKDRPSFEVLKKEIEIFGYSATGRKYGVSDNAVRKWLKQYMAT